MSLSSKRRARRLNSRAARKAAARRADQMERRLVLDVSVSWNGSALSVDASADAQGDDITVDSFASGDGNVYARVLVNGNVKFDGSRSNPPAPAANVLSIHVEGSEYADSIGRPGWEAKRRGFGQIRPKPRYPMPPRGASSRSKQRLRQRSRHTPCAVAGDVMAPSRRAGYGIRMHHDFRSPRRMKIHF